MAKMHENEVDTDSDLVGRLLAEQFPELSGPLTPVESAGTVNALYRLGGDLVVRLPRIHWAADSVAKEQQWLPRLGPHLPLAVPRPIAMGQPSLGYPWRWSIYEWLDGVHETMDGLADPCQTATELAQFITALQRIDAAGGPLAEKHDLRGVPLARRDASTRDAIASLGGLIDADAAMSVWKAALSAPAWEAAPVWFHGDLLPGNVLFEHGRLSAVIDFGGLGVGDPACDLMIAWALFRGESRKRFRQALAVDDATWIRGRGHAVSQAAIFIPYYLESNPVGVRNAMHLIQEAIADHGAND